MPAALRRSGSSPLSGGILVFETASLALYLIVTCRILQETGWAALVALLAFPAVFWTLGLGQNSFLTAALFGAGLLCIDRRAILAGLLFGAFCYKPHFGVLMPVALIAWRHWRASAAAIVSVGALCTLSLILFGWERGTIFSLQPPYPTPPMNPAK